jgi:hypothetical protein
LTFTYPREARLSILRQKVDFTKLLLNLMRKRRDALEPDELISAVVDAVARGYFQGRLAYQATCAIRGRIQGDPGRTTSMGS